MSHLSQALLEVDRIQQTVSKLLDLDRPHQLKVERLELTDLIKDAMKSVGPYAESQNISFEHDLWQVLPVSGDREELRRVFVNLLLNACQAIEHNGLIRISSEVKIASNREPAARRRGVVTIADTGPGIGGTDLSRVFDPFYTTKKNGTGLGLPICLEIVTRHGGTLELRNGENGALALIDLPLQQA